MGGVPRWLIGLTIGVVGVVALVLFAAWRTHTVQEQAAADAQREHEETRRLIDRVQAAQKSGEEAQRKRLNEAAFRATRTAVIDGQCLGQGKPKFGYTIEGSTYADNVVVGRAAACVPFGNDDNNITNFFCCKQDGLGPTLQIKVNEPEAR